MDTPTFIIRDKITPGLGPSYRPLFFLHLIMPGIQWAWWFFDLSPENRRRGRTTFFLPVVFFHFIPCPSLVSHRHLASSDQRPQDSTAPHRTLSSCPTSNLALPRRSTIRPRPRSTPPSTSSPTINSSRGPRSIILPSGPSFTARGAAS